MVSTRGNEISWMEPNLDAEIYMPLSQPLMPMQLLKIRNFSAVVVVGCVGQMVFYALNAFWPTGISVFFTTDNIKIGLMSVRAPYPLL